MLSVTYFQREFRFKQNNNEIKLEDPNPGMTPDQIMSFYALTYSELTTATVSGPSIIEDKEVYEFKTTIGTKG